MTRPSCGPESGRWSIRGPHGSTLSVPDCCCWCNELSMRCRKVCEQAASGGRHASERPADPQSGIQSGSCRRPGALRGGTFRGAAHRCYMEESQSPVRPSVVDSRTAAGRPLVATCWEMDRCAKAVRRRPASCTSPPCGS